MIKCEQHNWLYEEFDEPCPLCEVAQTTTDNILTLIGKYKDIVSHTPFDAAIILDRLAGDIKNG
jgi:hypothetical protein